MKNTRFVLIIILSMILWGASWTSGKIISSMINSPEVIAFWRFFITFISFIPLIIFLREPIKLNKQSLLYVILGSLFLVSYNLVFFSGLRQGGFAGKGSVIVTTLNPIVTFFLSSILFGRKLGLKEWIGLMLGLMGGIIQIGLWKFGMRSIFIEGNLFFLIAVIAWASLSITSQKSKNYMSPYVFSFYTYGLSALFVLPFSYTRVLEVTSLGLPFWLNILYMSVIVTTFATTAYFVAAGKFGASKASSFIFIVPASAIFFSWLFLKEPIELLPVIGGILAIGAVYLINSKTMKRA